MAPLAGPSGAGANGGQAPQPAKNTRLIDAMGRWSAAVKIAGQETEIFKVEHQVGKTTCYIAAEEGKEFEVRVEALRQPHTDESTWLHVDGMKINGHVRQRKHWTRPDKYEGKRVSPTEIRPFVFAPIALTDDASEAVRDEAVIKGLGTIRLEFYRVVYEGRAQRKESYAVNLKQQLVDEKCKKASMSHSTVFGAPKLVPAVYHKNRISWIDKWRSPMYCLTFQYRSRALLEIDGIAEPLEAPEPVPEAQARVPSTSASPAPGDGSRARSSSADAGKKNQKRKKIELTLSDSSDEDSSGGDLRAKIARLEAENARLRGGVKAEPGVKVEDEIKVKKEKYTTTQENGKVVLDLLDE
ncbi:hypothetical protein C6P46_005417 [Rhodotorula mucilaginosa]|uniref:DUF7918 domain-containing protein n=1 Tax=Rhodotorula mucilaginosa TaxID=5537 RepID=A0A9P7B8L5_RHOMI|nr:hypothetical protein C6P46_005417 [Rhodotorula mucilaginosa]